MLVHANAISCEPVLAVTYSIISINLSTRNQGGLVLYSPYIALCLVRLQENQLGTG